ncbi:MAG: DUF1353 domain-containing protein [Actinomycetota bacterium]|nr:DUF1353 domain-containing protein [Actinomycetota bacterium]
MPFRAGSEVDVKEIDEKNWELLRELNYDGTRQNFVVPVGMGTDFASVPRVFIWFLPQYGRYTKAAILHDYLWRRGVPGNELTLPEADAILRRAMRELGVPFLRRWIMWAAVRLGALKKPGGRTRWLRESWKVFPLALLALPIVGPPAILILVALALFYAIELVVYLPLRVVAAAKRKRPQATPPKQVNAPELTWKSA